MLMQEERWPSLVLLMLLYVFVAQAAFEGSEDDVWPSRRAGNIGVNCGCTWLNVASTPNPNPFNVTSCSIAWEHLRCSVF